MLAMGCMLPFKVLRAVRTWFEMAGGSVVCYCLSNYLL